jgi:aminopeptidase N
MYNLLCFCLVFTVIISCSSSVKSLNEDVVIGGLESSTSYSVDADPCHFHTDNHTYARLDEVYTIHLSLDLSVDFENKIISGSAKHLLNNKGYKEVIFDVSGLTIKRVTKGKKELEARFSVTIPQDFYGSALVVEIDDTTDLVTIYYETTKNSYALDWLEPKLTFSKNHPFLYTQGQAILTRTWIPIQDTPENRITYDAKLKVPSDLMAIMSANNPKIKSESGEYYFEMNQPIPAYLIALVVGELEYRQLDHQTGVYAEPAMVNKAKEEFSDIPKMMKAAQGLYGEYLWDQFDVVVLPNSFPFGGMENPRLTFATPTLIAGDKSLVSVIAHELAHSWSGNLVTNASWDDIWLNEGFTVYFENRIMEDLYGKEVADMLLLIEVQELLATIQEMEKEDHIEDTYLKLNLACRNPDEGLSDIAYVKGALFLKTIEEKLGRDRMDDFLTNYFSKNAFKTLTTEDFVTYFNEHVVARYGFEFNLNEWIYGPGLPDNVVVIKSNRFEQIQKIAEKVMSGETLPEAIKRSDYLTQEWLAFIRTLDKDRLSSEIMASIDNQLGFAKSGNAEIMTEWFLLAIDLGYEDVKTELSDFLIRVGRRKFLAPLYKRLAQDEMNLAWAKEVYEKARPNYHAVSYKTIDEILGLEL